jgi:hypothetical protein
LQENNNHGVGLYYSDSNIIKLSERVIIEKYDCLPVVHLNNALYKMEKEE